MSCIIISPVYSQANSQTIQAVQDSGLKWKRLEGCSDLVRARSVLLTSALESAAQRFILLDSDIVPTPAQLKLAAKCQEVGPEIALFGPYYLKDGRQSVAPLDKNQTHLPSYPIELGGLGFVVIHRDSLELVADCLPSVKVDGPDGDPWKPFCLPIVQNGRYWADDGSLCLRLSRVGVHLMADKRFSVGHAMSAVRRPPS